MTISLDSMNAPTQLHVDYRGSSKNNFRTYLAHCVDGCFVFEICVESRKRRVAVASRVEDVPEPTI